MRSRREFLATVAAGVGAAALRPKAAWAARGDIQSRLPGIVGLQLWSVRNYGAKDVPGTLAQVRGMGFKDVESAGLWGKTAAEFRAALDKAGLRCQSSHMGFDRLRDDAPGAMGEAKVLGATEVICAWIPHEKEFTPADVAKAADVFNRAGKAAREAGLTFAYHCHGYENVPSPEGTLFDTLAKALDPALVGFQIDCFHAFHGGMDPAKLITRYGSRVRSLHLKDMKKGSPVEPGAGTAPPEFDVPVGTGQIDWTSVLKAAVVAGARRFYVEDESTDPMGHIPQSVAFLEGLQNIA
jgi:sugar phosphate isomerase/epimerase